MTSPIPPLTNSDRLLQEKTEKIKKVLLAYNGTPKIVAQIEESEKIADVKRKFSEMQRLLNAPLEKSSTQFNLLHVAANTLYKIPGEPRPGKTEQMLQDILDAGAEIGSRNLSKLTPLHSAVIAGNLFAIQTLLQHGADPSAKDCNEKTPLDHAQALVQMVPAHLKSTYEEIVSLLFSKINNPSGNI